MRTDIHTHLLPPISERTATAGGVTLSDDGHWQVGSHAVGPPGLYSPEKLIRWLPARGLDRALVSVPPPGYRQGLSPEATAVWVRGITDALREVVAPHDELEAAMYLPLDRPDAALAELERLSGEPGFVAFTASAGGKSLSLADPDLGPVLERIEQMSRPLLLHPGASPDERLQDGYLHNLIGNPIETTVAASQLLIGGVLPRYPRLRIGLVHGGGALAMLLARLQQGLDTSRPGITRERAQLSAEAQRLWTDALTHDAATTRFVSDIFGAHSILVGSDWPFPMGLDDPMEALRAVDADLAQRAVTTNAAIFLGPESWGGQTA